MVPRHALSLTYSRCRHIGLHRCWRWVSLNYALLLWTYDRPHTAYFRIMRFTHRSAAPFHVFHSTCYLLHSTFCSSASYQQPLPSITYSCLLHYIPLHCICPLLNNICLYLWLMVGTRFSCWGPAVMTVMQKTRKLCCVIVIGNSASLLNTLTMHFFMGNSHFSPCVNKFLSCVDFLKLCSLQMSS